MGGKDEIRPRSEDRTQALREKGARAARGTHPPIDLRRDGIAAVAGDPRQGCDPLDAGIIDQRIEDIAVVARDAAMAAVSVMQEHQDIHRASRRFRISTASSSARRQYQGLT